MKYLILSIALISLSYRIASQPIHSFIINGRINADSGAIILMPITDSSFYPLKLGFQCATIVKGEFIFKGHILYPYAFQIGVKTNSQWK
ncbi:MAG TPA: hypothetical protein VF540_11850, partial [Segetibacter sp.]